MHIHTETYVSRQTQTSALFEARRVTWTALIKKTLL